MNNSSLIGIGIINILLSILFVIIEILHEEKYNIRDKDHLIRKNTRIGNKIFILIF